jgi:hypothetical protein
MLFLHALNDTVADLSNAIRLHTWSGRKATLRVFPSGDHNSLLLLNREEYFGFLERFLRGTGIPHHAT